MSSKKWFYWTISLTLLGLFIIAGLMIWMDPYFHYHKPLAGVSYRFSSERYMNYGIAKHFEYDAVITGSSMNQNFKTSEFDRLWGTHSIKVPFSGAGFQEISKLLDVALSSGNKVKTVLWGIDYNGLRRDYYWKGYSEYPDYLYDNNMWNDVSYIWNKSLFFEGFINNMIQTIQHIPTTTFDEYSSWEVGSGWDQIRKTYSRSEEVLPMETITDGEESLTRYNITVNIVDLVNKYPEVQFLFFYTPYSALYWESIVRDGTFEKQLEYERVTSELLLGCPNVKLYSFVKKTDITGNVNNYRDKEHYVASINDVILQWIKEEDGLLTQDNYMEYIDWERQYYSKFDYDILYE